MNMEQISSHLKNLATGGRPEWKKRDPIKQWISEILKNVETNKTSGTNVLLLSDIDDTLYDTSLRSYERFKKTCEDKEIPRLNIPDLWKLRSKGQRAVFEPILEKVGVNYNSVRDEIVNDPNFYINLPSLLNPHALNEELSDNVMWGGYISSRPEHLGEITKSELEKSGFSTAPILFRPQEIDPQKTLSRKIKALKMLRKELDKKGLKKMRIAYVDDYEGNIERIAKECRFEIELFLCKNNMDNNMKVSRFSWDEIAIRLADRSEKLWLQRLPYPSASNLEKNGPREKVLEFASTSPTGVGEVLENLFRSAMYPSKSLGMIKELDEKFLDKWFHDYAYIVHDKYKENSVSALFALYFFTRDIYMPLRILHMLSILKEVGPEDTLHLMARDTLPELIFASQLKKTNILHVPKMNYVTVSTRLLRQMDDSEKRPQLIEFLKQFDFDKSGKHWIVDIGFSGETPHRLSLLYPGTDFETRFLMSLADDQTVKQRPAMQKAKGYIFDKREKGNRDDLVKRIIAEDVKNIRLMEDSFGGPKTSSTDITREDNGQLKTNASIYPSSFNQIRKEVALLAMRDASKIYIHSLTNYMPVNYFLDRRNAFISNFKHFLNYILNPEFDEKARDAMFVPHEPTNLDPNFKT